MDTNNAVIITGASGGLGREVTRDFLEAGHSVIGLRHNRPIPFAHPNLHDVQVDLRNLAATRSALAHLANGRRSVFHLAHHMNYGQGDYKQDDVQAPNPAMFRNLVEALGLRHRYTLMSSVSVYGPGVKPRVLTTQTPIDPYDGYTNAKAEMEDFAGDIGAFIIRCPRVVAAGCNSAVNTLARSAVENREIVYDVKRDGSTLTSSFATAAYLGNILRGIHQKPEAWPQVILPSEVVLTFKEIARFLADKTGARVAPRQTDAAPHHAMMLDNTALPAIGTRETFLQKGIASLIPCG